MATKSNCPTLAKVLPDEPIFVLRAQDMTAPEAILEWIRLNLKTAPTQKITEALNCVSDMRRWPNRKMPD